MDDIGRSVRNLEWVLASIHSDESQSTAILKEQVMVADHITSWTKLWKVIEKVKTLHGSKIACNETERIQVQQYVCGGVRLNWLTQQRQRPIRGSMREVVID